MKKFIITLIMFAGMLAGVSAYAQTNEQPHKVYCEIISTSRGMFSNKTSVELDFGQYASWWSSDRNLVDENGKTIDFNSILDAVNYMAARGWVFEQMYVVQTFSKGDSDTPAYHWIMSKDVTDPSQILEGLQTRGDNK
jgi:hypothetical protein